MTELPQPVIEASVEELERLVVEYATRIVSSGGTALGNLVAALVNRDREIIGALLRAEIERRTNG